MKAGRWLVLHQIFENFTTIMIVDRFSTENPHLVEIVNGRYLKWFLSIWISNVIAFINYPFWSTKHFTFESLFEFL